MTDNPCGARFIFECLTYHSSEIGDGDVTCRADDGSAALSREQSGLMQFIDSPGRILLCPSGSILGQHICPEFATAQGLSNTETASLEGGDKDVGVADVAEHCRDMWQANAASCPCKL